jgi:hypothetical protein
MPDRRIRVNPHVQSALWAAVLTIILVAGSKMVMNTPAARLGDLLGYGFAPGFYLAIFLGVKGGTDGLPNLLIVFALTFLIWWAVIDVAQTVWRWINAS